MLVEGRAAWIATRPPSAKALDPVLGRIQSALAPVAIETWLGIGVLGGKDDPVAWPFVGFITTLAKLAGVGVPPGFVPIVRAGDQPVVRLLG